MRSRRSTSSRVCCLSIADIRPSSPVTFVQLLTDAQDSGFKPGDAPVERDHMPFKPGDAPVEPGHMFLDPEHARAEPPQFLADGTLTRENQAGQRDTDRQHRNRLGTHRPHLAR